MFRYTQLLDLAHFFDDPSEEAPDCVAGVVMRFGLVSGFGVGDEESESGMTREGVEFEVGFGWISV